MDRDFKTRVSQCISDFSERRMFGARKALWSRGDRYRKKYLCLWGVLFRWTLWQERFWADMQDWAFEKI